MVGCDAPLKSATAKFPTTLIAFCSGNKIGRKENGKLCKTCLDGMTDLEIVVREKRLGGTDEDLLYCSSWSFPRRKIILPDVPKFLTQCCRTSLLDSTCRRYKHGYATLGLMRLASNLPLTVIKPRLEISRD